VAHTVITCHLFPISRARRRNPQISKIDFLWLAVFIQ
jgi:hypothetical protein